MVSIFELCQSLHIDGHVLALTPCPKASTGLVAIAKNRDSLQRFRTGELELHFVFVAICFGGFKKKDFCIDDDISGRKASTHVKVLNSHQSNCAGQNFPSRTDVYKQIVLSRAVSSSFVQYWPPNNW